MFWKKLPVLALVSIVLADTAAVEVNVGDAPFVEWIASKSGDRKNPTTWSSSAVLQVDEIATTELKVDDGEGSSWRVLSVGQADFRDWEHAGRRSFVTSSRMDECFPGSGIARSSPALDPFQGRI